MSTNTKPCARCGALIASTMLICPTCGERQSGPGSAGAAPRVPAAPVPPAAAPASASAAPRPPRPALGSVPLQQTRAMPMAHRAGLALGAVLLLVLILRLISWQVDRQIATLTPAMEAAQIVEHKQYKIMLEESLPENEDLSRLFQSMGDDLLKSLPHAPTFRYHFRVRKSNDINATTMPGGNIFIYAGLLEAFDKYSNGDRARMRRLVAATLAHEIIHAEQRHFLQRMGDQIGLAARFKILFGDVGNTIAHEGLQSLVLLDHSRAHETEADLLGAELLDRAGIGREAMVDTLMALSHAEAGESNQGAAWLSDHPLTADRIKAVQQAGQRR